MNPVQMKKSTNHMNYHAFGYFVSTYNWALLSNRFKHPNREASGQLPLPSREQTECQPSTLQANIPAAASKSETPRCPWV